MHIPFDRKSIYFPTYTQRVAQNAIWHLLATYTPLSGLKLRLTLGRDRVFLSQFEAKVPIFLKTPSKTILFFDTKNQSEQVHGNNTSRVFD